MIVHLLNFSQEEEVYTVSYITVALWNKPAINSHETQVQALTGLN